MEPTGGADDPRILLGRQLREAREDRKLNQTQVADLVGTDQVVVSRAERGLTTVDTQFRIARALGLDLAVVPR